jgi:hypothetical protein
MKKLFNIAFEEDAAPMEIADADEQLKIDDDKNTINGFWTHHGFSGNDGDKERVLKLR